MNAAVRMTFALALVLSAACSGEFVIQDGSDQGGGGGGDGADAAGNMEGESFYRTNVLPLMSNPRPLQPCTVCHQGTDTNSGPNFLGLNADASYRAILDAGLLGPTPPDSRFYTRGAHAGDEFSPNEALVVAEWIRIEANP